MSKGYKKRNGNRSQVPFLGLEKPPTMTCGKSCTTGSFESLSGAKTTCGEYLFPRSVPLRYISVELRQRPPHLSEVEEGEKEQVQRLG